MRLLLELSMECESLARAEALSALRALGDQPRVLEEDDGVLIVSAEASPEALASRLGLCHHVNEWLASCEPAELSAVAEEIDVPGPIRVRATKVGDRSVALSSEARKVGGIVGRTKGVDLHKPMSEVRILFSKRAHLGRLVASVDRASFERRKNRYMPFVYPASIHPKYARAAVNLSEVPPGGTLLDPFCGTGSILIEAALVGCRAVGSDISQRMIEGCGRNLAYAKVSADLRACDVGDIHSSIGGVSGIVTDLPYGRSTSTRGEDIATLYARAYDAFGAVLERGARLVVVAPGTAEVSRQTRFRLVGEHRLRVHRSLTRHFLALERS